MNNAGRYESPIVSPRTRLGRMQRSNSIPEHSESTPASETGTEGASIEELLMRHSSPLVNRATGATVTSPLAQRNSSPSPLRLNRPRSNPRSRTPMRIPEDGGEQEDEMTPTTAVSNNSTTTGGRRITIRLGTGTNAGTNTVSYASRQMRQHQPTRVRSNKQGPSHRKARRWNNSNFVNLAAELSASAGSAAAVEALLKGSAEVSKHRSVFDPQQHESKAMKQFREDDALVAVRQQFFEGALPSHVHSATSVSKRKVVIDHTVLTPLERLHRIETRLRRIVVKACENSYAASKVVNALEEFFIEVYSSGEVSERVQTELQEILLEVPSVTQSNNQATNPPSTTGDNNKRTIKFSFDADSPTGGFHRLLLHAVCQFHCLQAMSSTSRVHGKNSRVLTATGVFVGAVDVGLVDFITERQKNASNASTKVGSIVSSGDDSVSNKLSALKV